MTAYVTEDDIPTRPDLPTTMLPPPLPIDHDHDIDLGPLRHADGNVGRVSYGDSAFANQVHNQRIYLSKSDRIIASEICVARKHIKSASDLGFAYAMPSSFEHILASIEYSLSEIEKANSQ